MITRTIRGMLSNNQRNQAKRQLHALNRLTCYDGIPKNMERRKRLVCPSALRVLRLAPQRDFCTLGRLSHEIGWQHQATLATLEEERKARSAKHFESKKACDQLYAEAKAEASKKHSKEAEILAAYGY